MKKVLFLGASGMIGPYLLPGLESDYEMRLADVKPPPDGREILTVDVTDYAQVRDAAQGMDMIMNFTVNRDNPVQSFHVNTLGALHVMKAAAELGIHKVIHSGPQLVRSMYDHEFDIADVPRVSGVGYYGVTKMLSYEICRTYARTYEIQTVCFVFNGLGARPGEREYGKDFPPFTIVWEDLQHACRLALEVATVPEYYQEFNLLSFEGHGKYNVDKARRMLGFEPTEHWEAFFKRRV
ncbi:MAG: NAD-dependent epimerase/dehydratase family protein [bacterium]|nr:NAD-dependent epimerase/dehydratase family protein [bacterium]